MMTRTMPPAFPRPSPKHESYRAGHDGIRLRFYKETAETIHQTLARLDGLQQGLLDAYARWDELDSRSTGQ